MKINKRIIALIITILAIATLIGVGVIFINKKSSGDTESKQKGETIKNNKSFAIEEFTKNNEGVFVTNYVDTANGFYFNYPAFIDLEHAQPKREGNVSVSRVRNYNRIEQKTTITSNINSIIDTIYLQINEVSKSIENLTGYVRDWGKVGVDATETKLIDKFTNNGIEWEKYNIVFEEGNTHLVYMFKRNELTYVMYFGALNGQWLQKKAQKDMTDQLWQSIVEHKEQIVDYIVKSFTFTDDIKYMLNLTEASILYYNSGYETESISVYDLEKDEIVSRITIPDVGAGIETQAHPKTEQMNIENVVKNITTTSCKYDIFAVDTHTYTIKHEGEIMTIKNSEGEEYKVRYYEIESASKDPKYSNKPDTEYLYAFETNEYVGVVWDYTYKDNNTLNYVIKNLSFRDLSEGYWDIQKFVK